MIKRRLRLAFFLVCLAFLSPAISAADQITIQLNPLPTSIVNNTKLTINAFLKAYSIPLTSVERNMAEKLLPALINDNLKAYGYFNASSHLIISNQQKTVVVHGKITLGQPTRLSSFKLTLIGSGKNNSNLQALLPPTDLKLGQPLLSAPYETLKEQLINTAKEQGYLDAHFIVHTILINRAQHAAKITLLFDTGPRYKFGNITIDAGNYDPHYIARFFTFKTGDYFSSRDLLTLEQNLNNAGQFSKITVKPDLEHKHDNAVPITVAVNTAKSKRYLFGMGYGTDTGARASLGWQWLRVNRFGHRFITEFKISQFTKSFLAQYIIPGAHPSTDRYLLSTGYESSNTALGTSNLKLISLAKEQVFHKLTQRLSLNLQSEIYRPTGENGRTDVYLLPSATWTYLDSNDLLFPSKAKKLALLVQGSPQLAISTLNFFQSKLSGAVIHTLGENNRIVLKGAAGITVVDDLSKMPLSLQFSSGGARSIRAYSYQSLGPGKYLKELSAEYQYRLFNKFYGTTFFDMGNATPHWSGHLEQGTGFGLMYVSPIGPIEITLARAISKKDRPYRIQFTMGPEL